MQSDRNHDRTFVYVIKICDATTGKSFYQEEYAYPVPLLTPDTHVFNENSGDKITIFPDNILTKYFCKRVINGC